ncbi:hypothetical protein O181_104784 [Austropuccinia psidii MF-1]|uniref:Uncharacterized protein n=1 Tax=Austropuccinia psidii MF-1 TaxID=1389203 RepID=A0A9Q3PKH1_9BASI|nr:hypothetical protein [Austropuccinia psidii MF-1]
MCGLWLRSSTLLPSFLNMFVVQDAMPPTILKQLLMTANTRTSKHLFHVVFFCFILSISLDLYLTFKGFPCIILDLNKITKREGHFQYWQKSLITTSDSIYDYQQSPAWEVLYPQSHKSQNSTKLELEFSLFTDWFNPLSNKATGKQVSLGVLALNCLNLPPTSQWKMRNTFLSGVAPEPTQPNMVTINNILKVFVD